MAEQEQPEGALTYPVLGLVAKAGGLNEMKQMRGVCKVWKIGFEHVCSSSPVLTQLNPLHTHPNYASTSDHLFNLRKGPDNAF